MVRDQCDVMVNIKREANSLQSTLHEVNEILKSTLDDIHVRKSLRELVDISYEARDVLDEFLTAVSINENTTSRLVMFDCLPLISFFLRCFDIGGSSSTVQVVLPFKLRFRLANDIKSIRKRLDEIMVRKDNILKDVREKGSGSVTERQRPESSAFADKQRNLFVGREHKNAKEEIMKKLRNNNDDKVRVAVIWGMGGVGKTTIAHDKDYNETLNEEDYPKKNRRWLGVGEKKFNANEIIMKIIDESGTGDVEAIQSKLVAKLKGDRFLIVLHDVWDLQCNEWDLLWNPLTNVGKGGVIIVTTRTREIISKIKPPVSVLDNIKPLSDEECWLIFESHAFVDGCADDQLELKLIGQQIVKKLKGLPLAAKVVGCSLLNEPDAKTWANFLEAEEWSNNDDIIPALRWSYNHLPSHLKQCFNYCALFPKDHVFNENELVVMWMAHDLIQNVEGGGKKTRPEDVGAKHFKDLVYRSLFDCIDGEYMMHDMIHDLALHVSNEEFATANASLSIAKMEKARHITIILDDDYLKNLSLCKSKRILTVYTPFNWPYPRDTMEKDVLLEVFKQLKSIRVLVLSHEKITEIPDCISKLKHLRYLDVSETGIKSLPDSLCDIHNLQMLAAPVDAILPKNIVNMANLRYLGGSLTSCEGVRHLTSLQELYSISVREHDNISELRALQQLRGKLIVKGLENVSRSEDAAQALMQDKLSLDELELKFNKDLGKSSIATNVLDALGCPKNLKCLKIVRYTGLRPPIWMVDGNLVANLRTLKLSKCHQLKFLPPLGELKHLKKLSLKSMHEVERLGDEFYGKGINGNEFFPSLKYLKLSGMNKWEEWGAIMDSSAKFFPRLKYLSICDCPSLVSVIPPTETCISDGNVMRLLKSLEISDCGKLTKIELGSLPTLGHLDVYSCDELISISGLVSVESLNLDGCEKLKSVSINFEGLDSTTPIISLQRLKICNCPQLQSLPADGLPPFLRTLQRLTITDCPQLQSLPADGLPPSLR